ncbi:unnamed protein product [Prunus armeniaca]
MSALALEVAINLLLLWIGIGIEIGVVAATTSFGGGEEMKILPTILTTRHPAADPAGALFGFGTTLALVKHACPGTIGLCISIIMSTFKLNSSCCSLSARALSV